MKIPSVSVPALFAAPIAAARPQGTPGASPDRVELGSSPAPAGAVASARVEAPAAFQVLRRLPAAKWEWTEVLRDPDPHFVQRNFHPRQVQRNPEIVKAFGTATPHSGDVLLHHAGPPAPGAPRREAPVLLVHGASKDGSFWWDPREDGSDHGLPQFLQEQGFDVYAVTFAHNHDDNFLQAEQVANAIERVKQLTGAGEVDLVGHSKGTLSARMYASDVREPWMTPFRGDVRRLVLIGGPNGGIDYSFRHPVSNLALYGDSPDPRLNAPMSWDRTMVMGRMVDTSAVGFGSEGPDHWPGQRQMLARWDGDYGLSVAEPDWYTTYHGGQGFVSGSKGIEHYMHQGGDLIQRLQDQPVDASVEVAVLAGNRPDVPGILNELAGPSDGLVFVASALKLPDEVRVVKEGVLPLHHKALTSEEAGHRWVLDALAAEHPAVLTPAERGAIREAALVEGAGQIREVQSPLRAASPEKPLGLMGVGLRSPAPAPLLSGLAMPAGEEPAPRPGTLFQSGGILLP